MVNEILSEAGFLPGITFRESRFLKPPTNNSYAVYNDSRAVRGSDSSIAFTRHSIEIELYSYAPDQAAEDRLEAALTAHYADFIEGWDKEPRFWIEAEQLYQTVYTFDYIEK